MSPIVRVDDSESDDKNSGEIIHVTDEELGKMAAAPGNELVLGDPEKEVGEQQADFTIYNNQKRPNT